MKKYQKTIFLAMCIIGSLFFVQFNVNSLNYDVPKTIATVEQSSQQEPIDPADFSIANSNNNFRWLEVSETHNMVFGRSYYGIYVYDRVNNETITLDESNGIGKGAVYGLHYIETTSQLVVGVNLKSPQITRISVFDVPSLTLTYSFHLEDRLSYSQGNIAYKDGHLFVGTYQSIFVIDIADGSIISKIETPLGFSLSMLDYDSTNDFIFGADNYGSQYGYYDVGLETWKLFNVSSDGEQNFYFGALKYIEPLDQVVMAIRNVSSYDHYLAFFNSTTATLNRTSTPMSSEQLPKQLAYDSTNNVIYFGSNSDWDDRVFQYFPGNQTFNEISQTEGLQFSSHVASTVDSLHQLAYFSCSNGLLEYNISINTARHISAGIDQINFRNAFVTDENYLYRVAGYMSSFKYFEIMNATTFEVVGSYDLEFIWGSNSWIHSMFNYEDSIFFAGQTGFKRFFKGNASFTSYAPNGVNDFRIFNIVKDQAAHKFYMTGKAANLDWADTYFWSFDIQTQEFNNVTLAMGENCDSYWEDWGPSAIHIPETTSYMFLGQNSTEYTYQVYSYNLTTQELSAVYHHPDYLYTLFYDTKTSRYFVGSSKGMDILNDDFSLIKTVKDVSIRSFANYSSQDLLFTTSDTGLGVCNMSSLQYRDIIVGDGLPTSAELGELNIDDSTDKVLLESHLGLISYDIQSDTDYFIHQLQTPRFLYPNVGQIVSNSVKLYWEPAIDSLTHSVTYDLYCSADGGTTWETLASDLADNEYAWDTTNVYDDDYLIKIVASCSDDLIVEDISEGGIVVSNDQPSSTTEQPTTTTTSTDTSTGATGSVTSETSSSTDSSEPSKTDDQSTTGPFTPFTDITIMIVAFITLSVVILRKRNKR